MRRVVSPPADAYLPSLIAEALSDAWFEAAWRAIGEGAPIPRVEDALRSRLSPASDLAVYERALGRVAACSMYGARAI